MGNGGSVTNDTPYVWVFDKGRQVSQDVCRLYRNSTEKYSEEFAYNHELWFRFEDHSHWDLKCWGRGNSFTIRESSNRQLFELVNNSSRQVVDTCPHFGRIEEEKREAQRQREEQQRREEEEKRRQAELERMRRIQEQIEQEKKELERREQERQQRQRLEKMKIQMQIEKENDASRRKLCKAKEMLQEQQKHKERMSHHQQTQVLHQMVEDHSADIERDEISDVKDKFEELLSNYQITGNTVVKMNLENRMKTLQNELTLKYFSQHKIPIWSQWALDQATEYVDLSLTEKISVLEAVVKVTLEAEPEFEEGQDKKIAFLFSLQDQLHVSSPTLARKVLINVLDMTSQLPKASKEILSQILFNNIWTPKEIQLFMGRTLNMDPMQITKILHKVCTYKLSCLQALSALKDKDPIGYIQGCASRQLDKDAITIMAEMQDKNYPQQILSLLEGILIYVEEELPEYKRAEMSAKRVKDWKRTVASMDLSNPNTDTLKEVLIGLSIAVKTCTTFTTSRGEKVQGYFPRLTQLASLVLLLLPPQSHDKKGCLLEIGTGEGKTCLLAMFATIQAARGTAVDIVTSSPLLAIRDQQEWKELYELFGVTSSPVPPPHLDKGSFEKQEELLEEAYRKQVVYGTVSTFAADILRQEFEKKTTRGCRNFECVIVDEVDYMTLDSGVQVTFLSQQASSLRHVEQVLSGIWALVSACQPIELFETGEVQWAARIQPFHSMLKQAGIGSEALSENDILALGVQLGFYSQMDLDNLKEAQAQSDNEGEKQKANENIMAKMGPENQLQLLMALNADTSESKVLVACYTLISSKAKLFSGAASPGGPDISMLLLQNGLACEIMSEKSVIKATVDKLRSQIKYSGECSLQSKKNCEGFIVIPSFLKEYVEQQLAVFAENALKAIIMTPGREYMIDKVAEVDRAGLIDSDNHQYDAIIPVDFQASGVLEKNKRWGDGLQQFLEMKHQLTISQLSNVTNYMSNVYFFKRYLSGKGIFGVSGTLGGHAEKAFLERQYKTACYAIPAHRHKKLVELPAVQVRGGNPAWMQAICVAAWRAADRGQVVLIICEDVKTADQLRAEIQGPGRKPRQITMYTISAKHNIEKQTFSQGHIIIATNLGGRGTDVHVDPEVNELGGLFVLLTYLPGSHRVEKQVFGRTARKGNPGMVQMVLNQDHLATVYQGHSVETMRQVREGFEVSRLDSMERNELFQIETKEELFSTFCQFLSDFDKNYTHEERSDISERKLKDVPACFKVYCKKLDYQAALKALKESWALWLILHEEHISQRQVKTLRDELLRDLKKTAEQLLQGRSSSFYDYIEVAKSRTDMHRLNKEESDYGALSYWQSVAECDPFYSAVALYNQAYIKVNLHKRNYITEAKTLLREADSAVDAYLSETSNAMMFCNFSVSKDFAPHHENGNLQHQMKARMSVFKAWKGYIKNALETLQQIETSKGQALTLDSSVYSLSRDQDPITTKELMVLHEFGLCMVFQVKKKPEFCIDAFLCFCLGVLQVAAGVLVCTLSSGTASQFGLGLINEGVSDMIHGVKGMIQGGFDWAEWAISKAISIGVSLVFGGLSRLKKAVSAVSSGTKGLVTGAKTCSVFTVKQCFKHAAKYAGQEMLKQVCVTTLNYAVDKGLEALFKRVLREAFETKVLSLIRANGPLESRLTGLICSVVPKTAMKQESDGFRIDRGCEGEMRQSVEVLTRSIIPDLMTDCTKIMNILDRLSEASGAIMQHVEKKGGLKLAMKFFDTGKYIIISKQIHDSFPSEDIINNKFIPQLLKAMSDLPNEKYALDERQQLPDVKRLKDDLISIMAESVLDSLVAACSRHMTSFMNRACIHKISNAVGSTVSNLLGRTDTQNFFDNQVYKNHMKQAVQRPSQSLSEAEQQDLERHIEGISDMNQPATALDIHVLTQSDSLQGKGIRLIVVDEHESKLTEDYFPGKDSSAEDITIRLRRYPDAPQQTQGFFSKMRKRARGEQTPQRGHFELVGADGSVIPVYSEGQNCLYYAVVQATQRSSSDLNQQALALRAQVQCTLQQDVQRYAPALRLQRQYEQTLAARSCYTISGGAKKERDQITEAYQQMLNKIRINNPELYQLMKTYKLGLVGAYHDVIGVRRESGSPNNNGGGSVPNADHIPPRDSLQKAYDILQQKGMTEAFRTEHPALYEIMVGKDKQLCRELLAHHHQLALTTGNSREARSTRAELTKVLLSGDSVKLMKMSLLLSNPEVSESLRRDAGISRHQNRLDYLSGEEIQAYHKVGNRLLVDGYSASGLLTNTQREELQDWLDRGQLYSDQTAEYQQLLASITDANNKKQLKRKR